jgi:CheY-like chemotaxis protein
MSGYRILTIDDDPDICMVLKTTLGTKYTVETASNGMEGLKLLDTFEPDFIVADINMPVMNGFETAEAIRHHPKFFNVPIFFLSGEKGEDIPRKSYEVGGNLFLRKPLDPMRLLKNIDYFLKESGLQPGAHGVSPQPAAAVAAPQAATASNVRVLTVDWNGENIPRLKSLFSAKPDGTGLIAGGPFETLWIKDPRKALGNLARWEPDLVIYNARNPGLDGIAFGQCLLLQKEALGQEIVFIASQVFQADIQYSESHFKRGVIDLTRNDGSMETTLAEAAQSARKKLRPKRLALRQIEAEEAEQQRQIQTVEARKDLERKSMFERYADIQQFIDSEFPE